MTTKRDVAMYGMDTLNKRENFFKPPFPFCCSASFRPHPFQGKAVQGKKANITKCESEPCGLPRGTRQLVHGAAKVKIGSVGHQLTHMLL